MLGLIALMMFGVLFLLTGSVVLPLSALILNVLSLTAAFGVNAAAAMTSARSARGEVRIQLTDWVLVLLCF